MLREDYYYYYYYQLLMNAKFLWEKPNGHELENKLPQNIASICQIGRNNRKKNERKHK